MTEETPEPSKKKKVWNACRKFLNEYIPITEWLPKYEWKKYFLSDLMAGLTLGSLQVPQGMASAMLVTVNPIMGLNTSCYSLMVYCLFGSAKISSFGPVSVVSLLTGAAIIEAKEHSKSYTNEELAVVITFCMGVIYIIAFILRFYVITKLFTEHLTSAFLLGCSGQIIIRSLKLILGIKTEEPTGYFRVIYNTYYIYLEIHNTNFVTLSISAAIFILFIVNTFVIIPSMKKCTKLIFPMELFALIICTISSYFLQFGHYNVHLLGSVPMGLPQVVPPKFEAVPSVWHKSLIVTSVNYATTIIMLLMINTDVNPKQELLALGITCTVCCNFQTIPIGNSIMRTVVAQNCGVKTLLSSIIASLLMLFVILWMGPLFSPLPLCVLGCIIIYGLFTVVVKKLREIKEMFNSGIENTVIWIVTSTTTFFISIKLGLLAGLLLTLRQVLASLYSEKMSKDNQNDETENSTQQPNKTQETTTKTEQKTETAQERQVKGKRK